MLRHDLLSFGRAFGEPVTAPHVLLTWLLGWTVGSVGGDALTAISTRQSIVNNEMLSPYSSHIAQRVPLST